MENGQSREAKVIVNTLAESQGEQVTESGDGLTLEGFGGWH